MYLTSMPNIYKALNLNHNATKDEVKHSLKLKIDELKKEKIEWKHQSEQLAKCSYQNDQEILFLTSLYNSEYPAPRTENFQNTKCLMVDLFQNVLNKQCPSPSEYKNEFLKSCFHTEYGNEFLKSCINGFENVLQNYGSDPYDSNTQQQFETPGALDASTSSTAQKSFDDQSHTPTEQNTITNQENPVALQHENKQNPQRRRLSQRIKST